MPKKKIIKGWIIFTVIMAVIASILIVVGLDKNSTNLIYMGVTAFAAMVAGLIYGDFVTNFRDF